MIIRTAKATDAQALLNIYRPYVEKTAITFEYDAPSVEEFQERIQHILEKYPYIVAIQEEKIIGYAYASPFKERAAYDWSVEVSIYLDMKVRHQGLGKRLYQELEEILRQMHIINVNACIGCPIVEDETLTNNSIGFHEHMGYKIVGKFHKCGYKFNRWYDMVWMEKMLGKHALMPEKIISFKDLNRGCD